MRRYTLEELQPEFTKYVAMLHELKAMSATRANLPASRWHRGRGWQVYSRCGLAIVNGEAQPTLCLANIELAPARRGRGFFLHLVSRLRSEAAGLGVRWLTLESVINQEFAHKLSAHGFERLARSEDDFSPNYGLLLLEQA